MHAKGLGVTLGAEKKNSKADTCPGCSRGTGPRVRLSWRPERNDLFVPAVSPTIPPLSTEFRGLARGLNMVPPRSAEALCLG